MKITHGMHGTPTYESWHMMIQRCCNKRATDYKNYGGRGIQVCKRWRKFQNFFDDMGLRPGGTSLDRSDNNKGYAKANCRWATKIQQERNRRNNTLFVYKGKKLCVSEWCEILNIQPGTIHRRRMYGWSYRDALFRPLRNRKNT